MDGNRFDDLIRAASRQNTRRDALRALAGGLLAALAPSAAAAREGKGRNDRPKKEDRRGTEGAGAETGTPDPDGPTAELREANRARCGSNEESCGGRCRLKCRQGRQRNPRTCECECIRRACRGGHEFNLRTCRCECPVGTKDCGSTCVGGDRCCPGEKRCGGGCIREDACCTRTHHKCPDGSCLPKGQCCPGTSICPDSSCVPDGQCCPGERRCASGSCVGENECCADEKRCPNGSCIAGNTCCPDVEVPCPNVDGGCCNAFAGEVCSDDGCCNTLLDQAVCNGKCTQLGTSQNCSDCGDTCNQCETCRKDANGFFACVPPNTSPPACERCVNGRVESGSPCNGGCCAPGRSCCGICCPPGDCRVTSNGEPCCLRVIDNRLVCQRG